MSTPYEANDLAHFVARKAIDGKIMELIEGEGNLCVSVAIGDPGFGKTMLLSKLYQDIRQQGKHHPIWLNTSERYFAGAQRREGSDAAPSWLMSLEEYRILQDYRKLLVTMAEDLPPETFGDFPVQVSSEWSRFEERVFSRRISVDRNASNLDAGALQNQSSGNVDPPDREPSASVPPTAAGEAGDSNVRGTASSQAGRDSYLNSTINAPQYGGVQMGDHASVGTVIGRDQNIDIALQKDQSETLLAIEDVAQYITGEFASRLNKLGKDSRVVLFIDDFQNILIRGVAQWIMGRLVPDLENVAIVLARTASDQQLPGTPERLERIHLKPFTLQEIANYLELRLGLPVQEGLADTIAQFSIGHPQAVGMAVDCVIEYRRDYPDLLRVFETIPDDQAEQLMRLISELENAVEDRYVRLALNIGAVVRRFDAGLLQYMMAHWEENPKDAELSGKYHELIERMQKYSFVQAGSKYSKYHRTIREVMDEWLQDKDPLLRKKLHMRAASYFEQQLLAWEKEHSRSTSYERWYRYEDPVWQDSMVEWQYHTTAISDKTAARLLFLRLYFDAFWWWGAYREECPLCKRLLVEWREAHNQGEEDEDDLAWVKLLEDLEAAYASGYQKQSEGDWVTVGIKLVQIRTGLDLDGEIDPNDVERLYLKAMTNFFLAQGHRCQNVQDERTVRLYEEAYDLFLHSPEPDRVVAAWTSHNLGDLYLQRGDYSKALEKCQDSLQLVRAENMKDHELIANSYRVQADAYWEQGNIDNSFRQYTAAIFAAYTFLASPSPPDDYTVAFYREIVSRILDRLESLCDDGRSDQAFQNCSALRDFWKPYHARLGMSIEPLGVEVLAAQDRRAQLKRYLFPSEPELDQYRQEDSEFVQTVNWVVYDKGGTM